MRNSLVSPAERILQLATAPTGFTTRLRGGRRGNGADGCGEHAPNPPPYVGGHLTAAR